MAIKLRMTSLKMNLIVFMPAGPDEGFNIKVIAFGRWGAVQMVENLENMEFIIVPFGQVLRI